MHRTFGPGLVCFSLVSLSSLGCGGGRMVDDGGTDASMPADAGPTGDGGRDSGITPHDGGPPTDGGTPDDAAVPDGGPPDAGADAGMVDRSPMRTTVPFGVQSFDIDRDGHFVAVGRSTLGDTHLAIYCSGPEYRNVRLADDYPVGALVRRNRVTSAVTVAWVASGAAGLTAWFLRALPPSCDPGGPAPVHMFDAEWIDGSFESESVFAMDITDANDTWVVSRWGTENRLTRFESGLRREQIDIGSCDPRDPGPSFAMAIEPESGVGVIACVSGFIPATGMYVRRFDRTGLLETSWTPVAGTTSAFSTPLFDVSVTAAGDIALSRLVILTMPTRYERYLTTLTPTAGARGATMVGMHSGMTTQADGFVRDRGEPVDSVLVLRTEGTLLRYDLDATETGSAAGGALAGSSPVLIDAHGRTFAREGNDIVRNMVPLP